MIRRSSLLVCVLTACIGVTLSPFAFGFQKDDNFHGRKYKVPPSSANIEVTVVKDFNGKPIENAHVIFHPTEGDKDTGSLELKTDENGKADIDVIPIGDTITLQVIVNGYKTYGRSYKIDKPNMSMEVRLKRPQGQYSTYTGTDIKVTPDRYNGVNGSSGHSSSGPSKATPPASGNKSSNSGKQSNGNPSQPQPK